MNKFAKTLCMMAVLALAFVSCKKTETTGYSFPFKGSVQQFENVYEGDFDRAYMNPDNLKVYFEEGDAIMLFNIYQDPAGFESSHGQTYWLNAGHLVNPYGTISLQINQPGQLQSYYYGFYPAENVVDFLHLDNENRATFRMDAEQTYRTISGVPTIPQGALYMAAKDEDHNNLNQAVFNFQNICGVLSLKFYSPTGKTVTSIVVEDNRFELVGDITLKIHEVDPVYMTTLFRNYNETDAAYMAELATYLNDLGFQTTGVGNAVTLNCPDGVTLGTTPEAASRFFIVLRPLALLEGCHITVNFTEGPAFEINSTKNNVISPNVVRNMKAVNVG